MAHKFVGITISSSKLFATITFQDCELVPRSFVSLNQKQLPMETLNQIIVEHFF